MMNRYRFLPSYHYEDNSDGNIQNPAADQLRDYTIHGNHGKNLIPYPFADTTITANGITFTDNGDGTITANGTATARATFRVAVIASNRLDKTYTLSGGISDKCFIRLDLYDNNTWKKLYDATSNPKTINFSELTVAFTQAIVLLVIPEGETAENIVFKPQLELGETATEFEPYKGVGDKTINEIPYPFSGGTTTSNGVTFTDNGDGSLTLNGTATPNNAYYVIWARADRVLDKNKTYLLTSETTIPTTDAYMYMDFQNGSTNLGSVNLDSLGYKIVDPSQYDYDKIYLRFVASYQKTFDNAVFKPIIIDMDEHNLIPYPYHDKTNETISGVTRTINADGSVTLNGTAADTNVLCYFTKTLKTEKGKRYFLSGLPDKTTTSTYRFVASYRTSDGSVINSNVFYPDIGKGVVFSGYDGDYANVWIYIIPYSIGAVFDNITFRPRLIPIDFEPHGYRIPIKNQSETTTIYTADRVMDGESISFRKDGLPAVKLSRSNQLSVETAVKPSAVNWQYYKY